MTKFYSNCQTCDISVPTTTKYLVNGNFYSVTHRPAELIQGTWEALASLSIR